MSLSHQTPMVVGFTGIAILVGIVTAIVVPASGSSVIPIATEQRVTGTKYVVSSGAVIHTLEARQLEAELVPDAVIVNGAKEAIRYHAQLKSNAGKDGTIAWTVLAVDDVGRLVATLDKGSDLLPSRGQYGTRGVLASLPDGYYTLRIRAALHTKDGDDAAEAVQWLGVASGKVREMTLEDWYRQSRAGQALPWTQSDVLGTPIGGAK
jgi:hypothetical protein